MERPAAERETRERRRACSGRKPDAVDLAAGGGGRAAVHVHIDLQAIDDPDKLEQLLDLWLDVDDPQRRSPLAQALISGDHHPEACRVHKSDVLEIEHYQVL